MKVYYDKWGKRGFLNNFVITDSSNNESVVMDTNTLIDGSYIFKDVNFPQFSEIHWEYPLNALKTGTGMFWGCGNLTTFNVDLLELKTGKNMFRYCSNLKWFNSKLGTPTNCEYMFSYCSNLEEIDVGSSLSDSSILPSVNFSGMFYKCSSLRKFTGDLSKVKNGHNLFFGCPLETIQSDSEGTPINLSSLTNGAQMFYYSRLLKFDIDLNNVTNASGMFGINTWKEKDDNGKEITKGLTSFTGGLNSLQIAGHMFVNCHAMTKFKPKGGLPNLTDGVGMFSSCIYLNDYVFNFRTFDSVKIEKEYKAEYDSLVDKTNYPTLNDYVNEKVNEKYKAEYDSLVDKTNYPTLNDYVNEKVWEYITSKNYFINGTRMFNGCISLSYSGDQNNNRTYNKIFDVDLSLFKNGNRMFERCYILKFNSKLDSLIQGYNMFENVVLDKTSISNIAKNIQDVNDIEDNIKTLGWKYLTITIDKNNTTNNDINAEVKTEIQNIVDKGWTVAVNLFDSSYYNGDGYAEDGIPYYAKRFETTSKGAPYIDKDDANKYYYVLGGHFIFPKSEQSSYTKCTSKATYVSTLNLKSNPDRQ